MFNHHFKVAWLQIKNSRFYAVVNVAGLSSAFAAALMIGLLVREEFNYETWVPNHENIYRLEAGTTGSVMASRGPSDLGLWVEDEFPQISHLARMYTAGGSFQRGDTLLTALLGWVDVGYFDVFQFDARYGDLAVALDRPDQIAVSSDFAYRMFGRMDVVGESLILNRQKPLVIAAVLEPLPEKTDLILPDVYLPGYAADSPLLLEDQASIPPRFGQKPWTSYAYFRLEDDDGTLGAEIQSRLPEILDRRAASSVDPKPSLTYRLTATPIADIHLSPDTRESRLNLVFSLGLIAILILLGACVNYINLMTARGMARAREVGIRKSLGADRRSLVSQCMAESFFYVMMSTLLACFLVEVLLPWFNAFLSREIQFNVLSDTGFLGATLLALILVAIIAGAYPAFVLSTYPAGLMKPAKQGFDSNTVRKILTVVQFSIMTTLLIVSLVIDRQAQYGLKEALNQTDDPVVIVSTPCSDGFQNAVNELPGVIASACSAAVVQFGISHANSVTTLGDFPLHTGLVQDAIDENYFELYGFEPIAGRFFKRDRVTDHAPEDNVWDRPENIIINEAAVKSLGYGSPDDAIGQQIEWAHYFRASPSVFSPPHVAEVIGVVGNFDLGLSRRQINLDAAGFYMDLHQGNFLSIKVRGEQLHETLEGIDQAWSDYGEPGTIRRFFFDERTEALYQQIIRQSQLVAVFSGVAAFICIIGMLGLTTFVAQKRTKEIGIRKVVGGGRVNIIVLMLWEFTKPVFIATLIAWPLALTVSSYWLAGYTRTFGLHWWVFVIPSIFVLLIALLTVFCHAFWLSGCRPANELRYE